MIYLLSCRTCGLKKYIDNTTILEVDGITIRVMPDRLREVTSRTFLVKSRFTKCTKAYQRFIEDVEVTLIDKTQASNPILLAENI